MAKKILFALGLWALCLAGRAESQITLSIEDGEIGGDVTFIFEGTPNARYLNVISLQAGPTCFPPPHISECVPIGLDLFKMSFQIPGFFGQLNFKGKKKLSFNVPDNPILDGIALRDMLFDATGGVLNDVSDLHKITFAYSDTFALSLDSMIIQHFLTPAVTLADDRVMIVGGSDLPSDHVEIYTPAVEEFDTLASLKLGRVGLSVTLLDDGRVLAVGGADYITGIADQSAEVYDPTTNSWKFTKQAPLSARAGHSATKLPDGRVLIGAGTLNIADVLTAAQNSLDSTEIYDPVNDTFTAGPTLDNARVVHTASILPNGDVLIAGGAGFTVIFGYKIPALLDDAQIYDSAAGTLSAKIKLKGNRAGQGAVVLNDGRVLLAGGVGGTIITPTFLDTLEWFDPSTGAFTKSSATLSNGRAVPAMVQMVRGDVLLAGGERGNLPNFVPVDDADLYDPVTDTCVATVPLNVPRSAATAVLLPDNSVGVFGGSLAEWKADIYHD